MKSLKFDLFISIATNRARLPRGPIYRGLDTSGKLLQLLKGWDARVNSEMLNKGWHKSPDRMYGHWFIEKIDTNPHWHGLVRIFCGSDDDKRKKYIDVITDTAETHWKKLIPAGTVEVRRVYDMDDLSAYITKELGSLPNYDAMVLPDQFRDLREP